MCRPDVRVVISCPMSGPASAGHGGCWGGPEEPFLQLVALEQEWVASMDPTFPLLERWPPGHSPLALYCWWVYPFIWRGVAGGTVNSHCYFLRKVFHKLSELVVIEVTKLCLEMTQCSPTWGSLLGRSVQLSIPYCGLWTPNHCKWGSMGLQRSQSHDHDGIICNSVMSTKLQLAHFKSSMVLKRTTDSMAK